MAFWEVIVLNSLVTWLLALGVFGAAFVVLGFLSKYAKKRTRDWARKAKTDTARLWAKVAEKTKSWFLVILALYGASLMLVLPDFVREWAAAVALFTVLLQAAFWGNELLSYGLLLYQRKQFGEDVAEATTMRAIGFLVRLALFSIIILIALDNIPGVEVTALIASLGIGGIAVALAVNSILADLFASLSISLDKPFVIGDFIIVGDLMGTVENIGLKTTRIKSLSGEQLVFSNNDLLTSRIRNYKRMEERRIVFGFNVTFKTPAEKIEKIPSMVREIIESQAETRFDRAHFKEFGDSSFRFESVYYMLKPDYNLYMDTQQAVNLALCRRFEEEGILLAYPTQTLYVNEESLKAE